MALRPAAHAFIMALEDVDRAGAETLLTPRFVGRAQHPSTVLGLVFHAAEHASRHTGQLVTTAKIVRGMRASDTPR